MPADDDDAGSPSLPAALTGARPASPGGADPGEDKESSNFAAELAKRERDAIRNKWMAKAGHDAIVSPPAAAMLWAPDHTPATLKEARAALKSSHGPGHTEFQIAGAASPSRSRPTTSDGPPGTPGPLRPVSRSSLCTVEDDPVALHPDDAIVCSI